MKTPLTFLLSLTFLFLFSGSVYGDDVQDGWDAYDRKDYKTTHRLWLSSAEQGFASAQYNLGLMYAKGNGVPQNYALAHMWFNLSGSNGDRDAVKNRDIMEKRMTPSQIAEAQRLAREWFKSHRK